MIKYIVVKTQFEGFHRWVDAPEEVMFLRSFHRHMFGVEVCVAVDHADRDVEFFTLKKQIDSYIKGHFEGRTFDLSCESIAELIGDYLKTSYKVTQVEVSEDGENAGGIHYGR